MTAADLTAMTGLELMRWLQAERQRPTPAAKRPAPRVSSRPRALSTAVS